MEEGVRTTFWAEITCLHMASCLRRRFLWKTGGVFSCRRAFKGKKGYIRLGYDGTTMRNRDENGRNWVMTNRNASASDFGWDFQHNAAIVLVLKNIKNDFKSVRVEGATEDIEINFNDGEISYIQAKASESPEQDTNVKSKLEKALESLNDASRQSNVKSLVFTTNNHIYPFNHAKKDKDPYISGRTSLKYSELSANSQKIIDGIIKNKKLSNIKIKKEKLSVEVIPFYGDDDDNRYKEIYKSVENFMDDVANRNIAKKQILEKLQLKFQKNASKKDVNITLTKEDIVWCIIAVICDSGNEFVTDEMIDEEFDGDYGLRDSVKEKYGFVIEDSSHKFQLISKVFAEYQKYKMLDKTKKYIDFIKLNWNLFTDYFTDVESDQQKMLIYMILGKIFNNRSVINNIRENVGGV